MAASNRVELIAQVQKVLKRDHKPIAPPVRFVLEHMLYACCLENSPHELADQGFDTLRNDYFDWNEVRVSSVRELTETLKMLHDPAEAASRVKQVLQSVFEAIYSFDLESLIKENIGQAVTTLQKYSGTTPFVVAYVTQQALGGHAIPVNQGLMESFRIIGIVSDTEAKKGVVPGLIRAIPKNKGVLEGSVLHNLGVLYYKNPYATAIKKVLLEIAPDCKQRLPKRPPKTPVQVETKKPAGKPTKKKVSSKSEANAVSKKTSAPKKKTKVAKPTKSKATVKTKTKKKVAKKKPRKVTAKKKPAATKKKPAKAVAKKKKSVTKTAKANKTSTKRLSKRKPK